MKLFQKPRGCFEKAEERPVLNVRFEYRLAVQRLFIAVRIVCLLMLTVLLNLAFSAVADAAVGRPNGIDQRAAGIKQGNLSLETDYLHISQKAGPAPPYFENLTPEERTRMQRQYWEWQSLPPEQRDTMRQRMDDLRRMSPKDRERYQQRYQQWQQLSPEDRRRIENNLQRWDKLSPQERDSIRQRFKN